MQIIADSQKAKQALADVEARHDDILKLESHISDLKEIFVDLALLVEAQVIRLLISCGWTLYNYFSFKLQGELVDRIEYNANQAIEYVEQAKIETKKAAEYQSSARRVNINYLTWK